MVNLVENVVPQRFEGGSGLTAVRRDVRPQPVRETGAAGLTDWLECGAGPIGGRGGADDTGRLPDVFTGVIPVQDPGCIAEVQAVNLPTPRSAVRREDLLFRLLIAALARQSPEGNAGFFGGLAPPNHLFVPSVIGILPVDATDFHPLPNQSLLTGVQRVGFGLIGVIHRAIDTDVDPLRWLSHFPRRGDATNLR